MCVTCDKTLSWAAEHADDFRYDGLEFRHNL
jgi:hypothetical protein